MVEIKVNDMKCGHCVMNIQKALEKEDINGVVSLEKKTVTVDEKDVDLAADCIIKAGYHLDR
ncbi:MAG: heavy-metal-associated domain-containing protein [Bacilli bacterium]